jgi:hypothetical protein
MNENEQLIFPNYINDLYKSIKNIVSDKQITSDNIISLIIQLMIIVEKFPRIRGTDKKIIIINTLTKFIHDTHTETDDIINFINVFAPTIIDNFISIDKKNIKIKIKKFKNIFFKCCK